MADDVFFVVDADDDGPMPLGHEHTSRLFWEKMEREGTDEVRDSNGVLEMVRDDWEGEEYESYAEALFVGPWYVDVYNTKANAEEAIRKEQDARRWLAEHPSKRESDPGRKWTNKVRFSRLENYDVASMPKSDWEALEQWHDHIGSSQTTDVGCIPPDYHYACRYDHESLFGDWVAFEDGTFRVDFDQLIQFLSEKERATLERIRPAFDKAGSHSFSEICKFAAVDRKTARKFQRLGLLPFLSTQEAE